MTDPSGFLQLGARYYWPEVGRFVQQDPLGHGVDWYAYARNAPLTWLDPDGLACRPSAPGGKPCPSAGKPAGGRGKPSVLARAGGAMKRAGRAIKRGAKKVAKVVGDVARALWTGACEAMPGGEGPDYLTAAGSGGTTAGNIISWKQDADWWYEEGGNACSNRPDDIDENRQRWGRAAQHW